MTRYDLLNLLAALSYVAGGGFMKATHGLTRPEWLLGVYVAFLLGCTLQTIGLAHDDLSAKYLMVLGLEAVAAWLLGVVVFGEGINASRLLGVFLVVVGIALLRR